MRPIYKRILSALVVVLSLGFLAVTVRSQWAALRNYQWQLEPGWALLALVGLELTWLFELATWRIILRNLGGPLPFLRATQIWFLSNLMRYIPGNVWQFLGMAEMAAQDGVPRLATLTSIVLHQVLSTAAGVALAAVYFASTGRNEWMVRTRPFLLLAPLGLFLLQPALLERILNWTLAKLGRPPLRVTLTWGQVWILLLRYGIVWVAMGLSFSAMVRALTPAAWSVVPALMATWTAAYVIGYLSMLTPSGLGVREGAMVLLLAPVFPLSVAAIVAIVARLWMVVGELVGAGIALTARPAWRGLQRFAEGRRSLDRQT
jgi:uncharacterized membrane protein YbhN (UPF0104 family)